MKKLNATYKGLLTGTVMILISLGIYAFKGNFDNALQYITYFVYIAGIIWTMLAYGQSEEGAGTFKNYFGQGFRCFIVVTLMMVLFTWVFIKLHPGLKEEMAGIYRSDLQAKGNYTATEIEEMVQKAKEYYGVMLTSMAVFGYLAIGSLVTLISAVFMSRKNVQ